MRKFYQLVDETVEASKISGSNLFLEEINNEMSKVHAIYEFGNGDLTKVINTIFEDTSDDSVYSGNDITEDMIDKVLNAIDK